MFRKKVDSLGSLGQVVEDKLSVIKSFSLDPEAEFFKKRKIGNNVDVESCKISGKLQWQVHYEQSSSTETASCTLRVVVPPGQKLDLLVTYYDYDSQKSGEISEEIVLKNITVELESFEKLSTSDDLIVFDIKLDEIFWGEESTLIKFLATT